MRSTALVMNTTIKNNFRSRAVAIVLLGVVFICVVGIAVLFGTQFLRPQVTAAAPDRSVLENYLGLILFTTSIISIGIYANVFAFQSMVKEKARGNIQALLATPLDPGEIWLGKSLGVFVPGLLFAVVMTLAALWVINQIYFVPRLGFIVTPWMIISNLVAVPLVYLALTLLVHLIGLIGKPGTANVIAQIFLPVMITVMINLAVRDLPNTCSWLFSVILLGVAAAIGILVAMARPKLTAEKIILSL